MPETTSAAETESRTAAPLSIGNIPLTDEMTEEEENALRSGEHSSFSSLIRSGAAIGDIPLTDEMTEEEEKALESGEHSSFSRLARGCLITGAVLLALAGLFMILESKAHICFFYTLPPHVLSLSCIAGSMLSLMIGLFVLGKNTFAMLVMILSGWTVLLVAGTIYLEDIESIHMPIPNTQKTTVMSLCSTPVATTLYIDEPAVKGVLSRHWKVPVHDRNLPLTELIELQGQETGEVYLIFDAKVWAVYDPVKDTWNDVLHHPNEVQYEIATEPTEVHKSFTVK
ncbi:MAG: hypothetical protein K5695_16915 [Oscillospiraceae bacterium]|nr:hypothetical protein [Oscillospiraceae bacterium]